MKQQIFIESGQRYGRLRVLGAAPKDKYGHICYRVICDCGYVYTATAPAIMRQKYGCKNCCVVFRQQAERVRHIGEKRNGWYILSLADVSNSGPPMYACRCLRCGEISLHTYGQITVSKSSFCRKCRPNYHFIISGNRACGTLNDGTLFWIDAAMIPRVGCLSWKKDKQGYIVGDVPVNGLKKSIKLHRFVLNADETAWCRPKA